MKKKNKFLILLLCLLLLMVAWIMVVTEKPKEEIQRELIAQAQLLIGDEIYIRAQPLLEEAAGYGGEGGLEAEQLLKKVYWALVKETGYQRKLESLIEKQVDREDSPVYIYREAADYYLYKKDYPKAIQALRLGGERTEDAGLQEGYEEIRYSYTYCGDVYQDVTEVYNSMIQVSRDNLWGLADYTGTLVIPCEYEKITSFSNQRAVVRKDGTIYSIDGGNHKIYIPNAPIQDFSNHGNDLLGFLTENGWVRGNAEFAMGTAAFETLGMYSNGYCAAKKDGKWGVIDTAAEWIVEPAYERVVMDLLGRCWNQNAVFVQDAQGVCLIKDGEKLSEVYEDAWPFYDAGWAAVKKNGKWGFIDSDGTLMIDYQYADARSFGGHLAAVLTEEGWGYISLDNRLVIGGDFVDVRSFTDGVAAIKTVEGWLFIQLDEYQED